MAATPTSPLQAAERRVEFPPFRPRAPWWTGDLQTVRNILVRAAIPAGAALERWPAERVWIDTGDGSGDRLAASVHRPRAAADAGAGRFVVVLVHGLGGCEESGYMQLAAVDWLEAGHPVVRLNLRGAGPSRMACRFQYDAGNTQDLRAALRGLERVFPGAAFAAIGFSLGGNLVLKLAGEEPIAPRFAAVVSVSAPIDLAEAAHRILEPRNALYHRRLLRLLKSQTRAPGSQLSAAEVRALESATTLREFDDRFTAPRGGYADADAYYASSSARGFLAAIRLPTLMIHAADDPWIPPRPYRECGADASTAIAVLLATGGGHVGFHGRGSAKPWHQICSERFLHATLG